MNRCIFFKYKINMLWILTLMQITYGIPCGYTLDENNLPIETDKEPWIN